jgi:hypothetical protein
VKRFLASFFILVAGLVFASPPLVQGELDVQSYVEQVANVSYQVSGNFYDLSVVGFTGLNVTNGQYLFTENILGSVDGWVITNLVYADATVITAQVVYAEGGSSDVGMVAGYAAVCSLSTNSAGFPQQPSPEYTHVSENMLSQIRNYSFRRITETGGGSTNTTDSAAIHTNQIGSGLLWNGLVLTATNTGSGGMTNETEPAFTNWLSTNSYVKVEVDPVFTNWLDTNAYVKSNPGFLTNGSPGTWTNLSEYNNDLAAMSTNLSDYNNDVPFLTNETEFISWLSTNTYVKFDPGWLTNEAAFISWLNTNTYIKVNPGWLTNETGSIFTNWLSTNTYVQSNTGDWAGTFGAHLPSFYLNYANFTNTPSIPSTNGLANTNDYPGTWQSHAPSYFYLNSDPSNFQGQITSLSTGKVDKTDARYLAALTNNPGWLTNVVGYVPTNDARYLAALTNNPGWLTNETYLGTITGMTVAESTNASSVTTNAGVLALNVRTNAGGGAGSITNIVSTDGSVQIAVPGGPQPNLSATNAVSGWSGYNATQQVAWVGAVVGTNLLVTGNMGILWPVIETGIYYQVYSSLPAMVWTNVYGSVIATNIFYPDQYKIMPDYQVLYWLSKTSSFLTVTGSYYDAEEGSALTVVYGSTSTGNISWKSGFDGMNWTITKAGVVQVDATNVATKTENLATSNAIPTTAAQVGAVSNNATGIIAAGGATGTPLYVQSYGTSSSTAYRGDWGASVSGQVAILNTNTLLLTGGAMGGNINLNGHTISNGAASVSALQVTGGTLSNSAFLCDTGGLGNASWQVGPGVSAYQNSSQVFPASQTTVLFPTVLYNYGNCWNINTGIFSPSIPGRYIMVANYFMKGGASYFAAVKDGNVMGRLYQGNIVNPMTYIFDCPTTTNQIRLDYLGATVNTNNPDQVYTWIQINRLP